MESDPRLKAYLELAAERAHPFYARQALRFAYEAGDEEMMRRALVLGAADYRPEPAIRMRTEEEKPEPKPRIVQLLLWDEAA